MAMPALTTHGLGSYSSASQLLLLGFGSGAAVAAAAPSRFNAALLQRRRFNRPEDEADYKRRVEAVIAIWLADDE